MRRSLVACAAVLAASPPVHAAPAADVVVLWSAAPPGPIGDAVADTAGRAGASYVDASPEAVAVPDPRPLIKRGITSYGALELDAALTAFDAAAGIVDQTGAALVDAPTLTDLFLYRALTHTQRGEDSRAWDDFLAAAAIDPTRILDPAGFPPRAIDRFQQARAQVAATPRGKVKLVGAAVTACRIRIDGAIVTRAEVALAFGRHWLDASCDGRLAVRQRLVVDRPALDAAIAGAEIQPPADAALLIQARTAAARAIVVATVVARTAVVRRIGLDGKERDRVTLAVRGTPGADARAIAQAVGRMLAVEPTGRTPWYRSPWTWAVVGAAAASAILIPVVRSGSAPSVTVRPTGVPEEWR